MTLRELLGDGPAVDVVALAYDNRAVRPGTLFFCVPGFTRDGHDYAPDAVARGAVALVVQRPLGLGVPEVLVEDVRAAMAVAAARLHGDPTAELDVVGITGTSGKTTTTFLVRHLLEAAGRPCGLLGGVTSVVGGEERPAVRTTPRRSTSRPRSASMVDAGDRACAMEVSSHALELRRVDGVRFAVAAFTNLSQDHLDFHPDMETYYAAKERLFAEFPIGRKVVVVDDEWGRRLAAAFPDATTVSLDGPADWTAAAHCSGLGGNAFTVTAPARPGDGGAAAARAVQRRERPRGARRGRRARARAGRDGRVAGDRPRGAGARAGRRGGAGLRGPRRLRAQAGGAGEGAAVGPRGRVGPGASSCSAPAGTATGASAR